MTMHEKKKEIAYLSSYPALPGSLLRLLDRSFRSTFFASRLMLSLLVHLHQLSRCSSDCSPVKELTHKLLLTLATCPSFIAPGTVAHPVGRTKTIIYCIHSLPATSYPLPVLNSAHPNRKTASSNYHLLLPIARINP